MSSNLDNSPITISLYNELKNLVGDDEVARILATTNEMDIAINIGYQLIVTKMKSLKAATPTAFKLAFALCDRIGYDATIEIIVSSETTASSKFAVSHACMFAYYNSETGSTESIGNADETNSDE